MWFYNNLLHNGYGLPTTLLHFKKNEMKTLTQYLEGMAMLIVALAFMGLVFLLGSAYLPELIFNLTGYLIL